MAFIVELDRSGDPDIRIRAEGALFDSIRIRGVGSICGKIEDGLSVELVDDWAKRGGPGFVLSWEDFEAAYLECKRLRDDPARVPLTYENSRKHHEALWGGPSSDTSSAGQETKDQ